MPDPLLKSPQLTDENLRQLADARKSLKKINRAVSVAKFDGWVMGIFGGLTLLFGFSDWINILIALALGTACYFELLGAKRLQKLEPQATRMLGYNQIGVGIGLIIYSLWQMYASSNGKGLIADAASADPTLSQQLGPYQNMIGEISVLFYVCLILVAIVGMGSMAMYYFSREKILNKYLHQTPPWIVAMQKSGASI
jgi:hypothetical protein